MSKDYDINTVDELLKGFKTMKEVQPEVLEQYTIREIFDDGLATGAINPTLSKTIDELVERLEK